MLGTSRPTTVRSFDALDPIVAPSRSCSSAMAMVLRWVVPSSSIDWTMRCVPSLPGTSAAIPASNEGRDLRDRHGGTLRVDQLDTIGQAAALDGGEAQRLDLSDIGQGPARALGACSGCGGHIARGGTLASS